MKKPRKERLDRLLVEKGFVESRQKAQSLIIAGSVLIDGAVVDKPGKEISPESGITIKETLPYVGRGGVKLEGFLDGFGASVKGLTVLDVGASTGGFTDCLLKRGALHVFAVDVGKGLLDRTLRNDPRVSVFEERNIRYMDPGEIGEKVDLATIDVSFISLEKVLPNVKNFLKEKGKILALIKPQFEVGKGEVGKGGIVKDPEKHRRVVEKIKDFSLKIGLKPLAVLESPILGAKGNKEFWIYLEKD